MAHVQPVTQSLRLLGQRYRGCVDRLIERRSDIGMGNREKTEAFSIHKTRRGVVSNIAAATLGDPGQGHRTRQRLSCTPGVPAIRRGNESQVELTSGVGAAGVFVGVVSQKKMCCAAAGV